jgi:hypothetical protein
VPDGTIAALDRMQANLIYAGITPQSTAPVTVTEKKFRLYDLVTWIVSGASYTGRMLRDSIPSQAAPRAFIKPKAAKTAYRTPGRRLPRRVMRRYIMKHYTYLMDDNKRKKKRKKKGR